MGDNSLARLPWYKRAMPLTVFKVFCFGLFVMYLLYHIIVPYDTDLPFLIAGGRDIIQNGITGKNPFIIDSNICFILQQWLYAVIIASVDSFGKIGMISFMLLQVGMLFLVGWLVVRKHHVSLGGYCFCFIFMSFINPYFYSLRPQNVTLILLLLECFALDRFRDTRKWQWLFLLPLTMVVEMNVHMSMWVVHYAIILAYLVPSFYLKRINDNSLFKHIKPVLIFTGIMTVCLFANPYGSDGIMFVVNSFCSGMTSYVDVQEHQPLFIISAPGGTMIAIAVICGILIYFKNMTSVALHLFVGFGFMTALYIRNSMFLLIALLYVASDIGDMLHEKQLSFDYKKDVVNYLYFVFVPAWLVIIFLLFVTVYESIAYDYNYFIFGGRDCMYAIVNYLDTNASKDVHIYGGYHLGQNLEYAGYTNIYMDARPESYTKAVNHTKDILRDYSRYGCYGVSFVQKDLTGESVWVDRDSMTNWLNIYDFDYFVIDVGGVGESSFLRGYLTCSDDYELVDYSDYMHDFGFGVDPIDILLYRKK